MSTRRQFAEVFPDREIVASLMRQLAWVYVIPLIPLDGRLEAAKD